MKIGILGGSFNPPHQGHLHLSHLALQKLNLDQIWWIVTEKNPLKNPKDYESHVARTQKCQDLANNHQKIKIINFSEIYTEKLIARLRKKYPANQFTFVAGADVLAQFHRWKNFKKIVAAVDLAIFAREDFLLKIQKFPSWKFIKNANRFQIFFTKKNPLSSSKIRKNEHYRR